MADVLVVTSKVKKAILAKAGLRTSGEAITSLSSAVDNLIALAIERAQSKKRKTVMAEDIEAVCANPAVD